jgi:hypothetical protein
MSKVTDRKEVEAATTYLKKELAKKFVEWLEDPSNIHLAADYPDKFRITEKMHQWGINIRYLGRLYQLTTSSEWKLVIFIEMSARLCKNRIRLKFRNVTQSGLVPLEDPYRSIFQHIN